MLQCIQRELREETGLTAHTFVHLGRAVYDEEASVFESFLCMVDCDKDAVTLQDGETVAYRWVNGDEMAAYLASDDNVDAQIGRFSPWYRKIGLM